MSISAILTPLPSYFEVLMSDGGCALPPVIAETGCDKRKVKMRRTIIIFVCLSFIGIYLLAAAENSEAAFFVLFDIFDIDLNKVKEHCAALCPRSVCRGIKEIAALTVYDSEASADVHRPRCP